MKEPHETRAAAQSIGKLYKGGHHSEPQHGADGEVINDPNKVMPHSGPHGTIGGPASDIRTPQKKGPIMGEKSVMTHTEGGILSGSKGTKNPSSY